MISRIKKDDLVVVISGKDKGKQGKIVVIDRLKGLVKVNGVNIVTKHVKPRTENESGKIVKEEAFIQACTVMPICPKTGKGCRVKVGLNDKGERVRLSHNGVQL